MTELEERPYIDFLVFWVGTKCSLRCRDCGNLIPYAQQKSFLMDEIIGDLKKFLSFCQVNRLQIQGGEPFTHPQIDQLIESVQSLAISEIVISTNGTIPLKHKTLSCLKRVCNDKVSISISVYQCAAERQNQFYKQLLQNRVKCEKYNFFQGNGQWVAQGGTDLIEECDDTKVQALYNACAFKCCISLVDGILYRCGRGKVSTEIFEIPLAAKDYLDIRAVDSLAVGRSRVATFLRNPQFKEYCRFCLGTNGKQIGAAEQLPDKFREQSIWRERKEQGGSVMTEIEVDLSQIKQNIAEIKAVTDGIVDLDRALVDMLVGLKDNFSQEMQGQSQRCQAIEALFEKSETESNGQRKYLKVAFFVQAKEDWNSTHVVWEAFAKDENVECVLVAIPFIHHCYQENPYAIKDFLVENDIPFVSWQAYRIDEHLPDVVFFQSPYDYSTPEGYTAADVAQRGIRIAYIPYGLELGGTPGHLTFQFNQPMQNLAWRIFSRSQRHKRMFGKYCDKGNNHVIVIGHPKFDRLLKHKAKSNQVLLEKTKNRKVFLWTPHFLVNKSCQCSTFLTFRESILRIFSQRKDIALILRPHPLLYETLVVEHYYQTELDVQNYFTELGQMDNVYWDQQAEYLDAFQVSDALLGDIGSFLLEYLPMDKPILFLHDQYTEKMNDDGAIVSYYEQASCEAEILKFVDMVAAGRDEKKLGRLDAKKEYLYGLDGKVGERIKDYVCGEIRRENGWE